MGLASYCELQACACWSDGYCSKRGSIRRQTRATRILACLLVLATTFRYSEAFVTNSCKRTPALKLGRRPDCSFVRLVSAQRNRLAPRSSHFSLHAIPTISKFTTSALPLTYMFLLALQFAVQPVLTKKFAPKTIIRSTYVVAQDAVRLLMVVVLLTATKSWKVACQHWTYQAALATAGFPAILYLVQSYCSLIAYQNLPPITFNVLNQTKTLSAAVSCFLLFGQRQSPQQVIALGIMLLAALVMEKIIKIPDLGSSSYPSVPIPVSEQRKDIAAEKKYFMSGVLPILVASCVSGLAGAWTQRTLRSSVVNNSLLFTMQLSIFSMLVMGLTLLVPGCSPDRERLRLEDWRVGWTLNTWIPIAVNSIGGILVGLVTKFSGAVPKGFALIAGTFMSGILQNMYSSDVKVTSQQWIGGLLAAFSIWIHSAYPHVSNIL